jgi:hypothetical protein
MDLSTMRTLVRRDLKDEDEDNYRWVDDEIDRAIARAVVEFSKHVPREMKTELATVASSAEVDISSLTDRISVDRVEFPPGSTPRTFRRFEVYQDTLTFLEITGDGNNCAVYWGKVHTLDSETSTIPTRYEDLIALGATAYATLSQSQYATNKATIGGENVDRDYLYWARGRLMEFEKLCKKAGGKLKTGSLYSE